MRAKLLRQDFLGGLAIVAVAAFAYWQARHLPTAAAGGMGPGTLPKGLALLLGALGVLLILHSFRSESLGRWSVRGPLLTSQLGAKSIVAAYRGTGPALNDANTRKRLHELGSVIPDKAGRSPQALQKLVESEIARWNPILKGAQ